MAARSAAQQVTVPLWPRLAQPTGHEYFGGIADHARSCRWLNPGAKHSWLRMKP